MSCGCLSGLLVCVYDQWFSVYSVLEEMDPVELLLGLLPKFQNPAWVLARLGSVKCRPTGFYLLLENFKIKTEAATSASVPKTLMRICFASLIPTQISLKSYHNINNRGHVKSQLKK